jgi:hypothetical protein
LEDEENEWHVQWHQAERKEKMKIVRDPKKLDDETARSWLSFIE